MGGMWEGCGRGVRGVCEGYMGGMWEGCGRGVRGV